MSYAFPAPAVPSVAIRNSKKRFPVHRIYCVGRNYAEHAQEMGAAVDREQPIFFLKPADAVLDSGADVPFPSATNNFHHEVELVAALSSGGRNIAAEDALDCVYGYAVGLDLTRRDLQAAMKAKGLPWDIAKAFDASAPLSAIDLVASIGHPRRGLLWLDVNGVRRQAANISTMVFPLPEIISELSKLFELQAGDLIFTGTPSGVGPLKVGDRFVGGLDDQLELSGQIA